MSNQIVKDQYKVVVTGDSISKGVVYNEEKSRYMVLEDNYVALLQQKLKGIICNTARFGNTIIKGIDKLRHDMSESCPDIVLIEYGGNDCDFNWGDVANNPDAAHTPKTDLNTFENSLKEIIEYVKNNGVIPVLMTLPPLNADRYLKWISKNDPFTESMILKWLGSVTKIYWWQERYSSVIIRIAEETHTKWIDVRGAFLQFPDFSNLLCIDGIHPNRDGHKVIASKIIDFVRSGYDYLLADHPL